MLVFWTSVSHSHDSHTKTLPKYPKKSRNPGMRNLTSEDTDEAMVLNTSFATVSSATCLAPLYLDTVKEKRNYQLWMRTGSGLNS